LEVMDGVPKFEFAASNLEAGKDIVSFLAETGIFPSKGEARKMVQNNGISINKVKITGIDAVVDKSQLLNGKYILVQKGANKYNLVIVK